MVPPPVMLAAPASVTDADALCQGSVAASTPYSSEAGVPPSSMHNGSIIVSHSTAGVSTNNAIASTSRLPSLQPGVASTSIHNSEANALNSINDVAHLPSLNKDTPKSTTVDNIMNDVTPLPSLNKETPKSTTVDNMMNDVAPLSSLTDDTAKASSADGSASTSHSTTNVMGTAGVETGSAPARHRRVSAFSFLLLLVLIHIAPQTNPLYVLSYFFIYCTSISLYIVGLASISRPLSKLPPLLNSRLFFHRPRPRQESCLRLQNRLKFPPRTSCLYLIRLR